MSRRSPFLRKPNEGTSFERGLIFETIEQKNRSRSSPLGVTSLLCACQLEDFMGNLREGSNGSSHRFFNVVV